ncbi:MAG TPA: hypothetical protein VG222_03525 [Vicinamibacterales bacterium]|nr:hypothetical protein [Vicinamibacterales bacterium]
MKRLVLVGTVMGVLTAGAAFAQTAPATDTPARKARTASKSMSMDQPAAGASLGTVHLAKKVMADGKPLPAGTYQVRLTDDTPKPAVGQSPTGERYVEFVRGGKVVGREVATVVGSDDIGKIAKGKTPRPNTASVEMLKGGDYYRVWINKSGNNYIINMPPAA